MEDSGQCVSRKFNNLSASILHNERERKCNLCKYRYQGIAQVRTNKSSATSHENASRSSSWFRFNDGIPVLVHCLFLLESAFFFVDDCHACNTILNTHFLYFFGHKGGRAYDFEEGKKKDILSTHSRAQNKYLYIYIYLYNEQD